jgi:hypothetical protein
MKKLRNRFHAWRARRRLEHLQRWERERAKGKARFVILTALLWSALMIGALSLAELYFEGTLDGLRLKTRVIYYLIAGPIVGLVLWWINEGRYKNARIEARIKRGGNGIQ